MIMTMIFSLKVSAFYGCPDANGMVIYLGKLGQSLPSFQTGFVVAPEKFRSQELFKCWTAKAI
jgi:hypothetical protein